MKNEGITKKEFDKLVNTIIHNKNCSTNEASELLKKLVHEGQMKTMLTQLFPEWWDKKRNFTTYLSGGVRRLNITCIEASQFKAVYRHFKPTTDRHYIHSATSKTKVINTPYRVDLKNYPKPQIYSRSKSDEVLYEQSVLSISYRSKMTMPNDVFDLDITIYIGVKELIKEHAEFFEEIIKPSKRKISDTEHHYFTGWSMNQLYTKTINCYEFCDPTSIKWSGGNRTLINAWQIDNLVAYLIES